MSIDISSFISGIVQTLAQSQAGVTADIVNAYTSELKPTVPQKPIIAVGLASAEVRPEHIGSNTLSGEIAVSVNIYVPYTFTGSTPALIFCEVLEALADYYPVGISSQGSSSDRQLGCHVCKNRITFGTELVTGGEQG